MFPSIMKKKVLGSKIILISVRPCSMSTDTQRGKFLFCLQPGLRLAVMIPHLNTMLQEFCDQKYIDKNFWFERKCMQGF